MAHKKIYFSGNPCVITDNAGQTGRHLGEFIFPDAQGNYEDPNKLRTTKFVVDADDQGLQYDIADFFHYSTQFDRTPPRYAFGVPYKVSGAVIKARIKTHAKVGISAVRYSDELYAIRGKYDDDNQNFFDAIQPRQKRFLSHKGQHRRQGFYDIDFLYFLHNNDSLANNSQFSLRYQIAYSDNRPNTIGTIAFAETSNLYDIWCIPVSFVYFQIQNLSPSVNTISKITFTVLSSSNQELSESVSYYCTNIAAPVFAEKQQQFLVIYENSFGRYETVCFPDFQISNKREFQSAVINRETRSFNAQISRVFKVQTGPNNEQTKAVVAELLRSENIFRVNLDNSYTRIVLSADEYDFSSINSQSLEFVESKNNYGRNQ